MTPVRALIAAVLAAVLFGAGLFIVAGLAGARPHDLLPLLSPGRSPFELWCFLGAWGALVFGALGVLTAFLAFLAPEEDDDPRVRRRGFPKGLPLLLVVIALALAFVALRCGVAGEAPIAVPVAPSPAAALAAPPSVPAAPVQPAGPPPAGVAVAAFQWRFMDPLMRETGGVWLPDGAPFADDAENERLLCGKAWVAVSGSASEEGPSERNAARARIRTERAMARAGSWLSQHDECGGTVVLGVDLGQHVTTAPVAAEGAATAYQRQILVASRGRAYGEAALSSAAAEAELAAFLADPANRRAFFGGRTFQRDPVILAP